MPPDLEPRWWMVSRSSTIGNRPPVYSASRLVCGFHGEAAIDIQVLIRLMTAFLKLLMQMADQIMSIEINPAICLLRGCVAAHARTRF